MIRRVLTTSAIVLLVATPLLAQRTTGSIAGIVRDASGAVLPAVTVTVTGANIVGVQTATTNEEGFYRFSNLPPGAYDLVYALGGLAVYGPLRNALGMSRVRVAYTAGEAIGPDLFVFYRSLGINLKQLYGSTETSVMVCVQPNGAVRPDTVGPPMKGVEIRAYDAAKVWQRHADVARRHRDELLALLAAGDVRPLVSEVFPLAETGRALRAVFDRRAVGKVVIEPTR